MWYYSDYYVFSSEYRGKCVGPISYRLWLQNWLLVTELWIKSCLDKIEYQLSALSAQTKISLIAHKNHNPLYVKSRQSEKTDCLVAKITHSILLRQVPTRRHACRQVSHQLPDFDRRTASRHVTEKNDEHVISIFSSSGNGKHSLTSRIQLQKALAPKHVRWQWGSLPGARGKNINLGPPSLAKVARQNKICIRRIISVRAVFIYFCSTQGYKFPIFDILAPIYHGGRISPAPNPRALRYVTVNRLRWCLLGFRLAIIW